jgi:predicted nucleic acid-binding protein
MNGNRYFFDTNAIIALLNGNSFIDKTISEAEWIGTSVICIIEFLSFPHLTLTDKNILFIFLQRIHLLGLSDELSFLEMLASFKIESRLKLPDSVIACLAIQNNAVLITNDQHFNNIKNLSVLHF